MQVVQADEHTVCLLLRTPATSGAVVLEERQPEVDGSGPPTAQEAPHQRTALRSDAPPWQWLVHPPSGRGKGGVLLSAACMQ